MGSAQTESASVAQHTHCTLLSRLASRKNPSLSSSSSSCGTPVSISPNFFVARDTQLGGRCVDGSSMDCWVHLHFAGVAERIHSSVVSLICASHVGRTYLVIRDLRCYNARMNPGPLDHIHRDMIDATVMTSSSTAEYTRSTLDYILN